MRKIVLSLKALKKFVIGNNGESLEKNKKWRNKMNKYKELEIKVIYLNQSNILTESPEGDEPFVEPGDGWED